jgi:DNA-binding MarR family transcriptional regulator
MPKPPASTPPRIPAAGEGKRGTQGYLAYLLRQANAATRLAFDRALADLDVTSPQFTVLVMVGAYQPLSSADLARLTFLTPQTINVIVRNLEERGAIMRRPHTVHGRILTVEMTPDGTRLLAQCRRRADRIEAHLEAGLKTAVERDVVRRWLSYIAGSLGAA